MSRSGGHSLFFTDEDFVWVEPALETAPTAIGSLAPPLPRPVRRRPRTLAGDLARLRAEIAAQAAALPPRARAVFAAGVLVALAVLVVVVTIRNGAQSPSEPRTAGSPAAQGRTPAQEEGALPALPTLQAGDRSPAVADLQRALGALGLYSQPVDGVFGDSTAAAVLAFQSEHGLIADAIAGPTTAAALVETLEAGARTDAEAAKDGLAAAVAARGLSPAAADRYRKVVDDSLAQLRVLPPGRISALALVLHRVAALAPDYNEARALTLFSMLQANRDYLVEHAAPAEKFANIEDADGIVYRYLPEHGFQFHPIAEFARLNELARKESRERVRRLADALVARGVRAGNGLLWEYYFPFGGPTRWASGFAQAIAAQALARSAKLLDDPKLEDAARAAFRGISRGLWLEVAGGPWVREYGFTDMPILNAQLQSLVSLYEYVEITDDELAGATVAQMASATRAVLPQFDTGCWSLYSLGGSPASLHYHKYHVSLLEQLAARTGDPLWGETAARWNDYTAAGGC